MTPPSSADISLYKLATSSEPQPQPLQISPATFKSLIGSVFDLLIEQQIAATIWLKLPKGDVWQAEFERFYQSATATCTVYQLHLSSEEPLKDTSQSSVDDPLENMEGESSPSTQLTSPFERTSSDAEEITPTSTSRVRVYTTLLAPGSQLKREYFLLVASPSFCGLTLVHRPRSGRLRSDGNRADSSAPIATQLNQGSEESLEQKQPLLGLCSVEPCLLQRVLQGVNQAIDLGKSADPDDATQTPSVDWDDLVAQGMATSPNPYLLAQLFAKQVQQQEDYWRSNIVYRKQAEQAIAMRHENEELAAALRLKDEFVQTLGQELRTPLTTMKTALSLLSSPQIKPQQRQLYMDMISHECDRQSSLITSVLTLIQLESSTELTMEPLRLADVVPGVVSTYQPLAQEKGVTLSYSIPENLPPVSCVTQWLKQIVINLLHNSIKFTPTGGQVWVRARQQDDSIYVEFRDTGVGIAQADLPKIFDRFYRTQDSGKNTSGAGLGLSIVQKLLLRCGGSVSVRSKLGEGSIFSILLPIYDYEIAE
jgi:two-component system, OmpR family, phosphate regulon sensor histidine kinase PhoR